MRDKLLKLLEYLGLIDIGPFPEDVVLDDGIRPKPGPDSAYYAIKEVDHDFVVHYGEYLARMNRLRNIVFALFVAVIATMVWAFARPPAEPQASDRHGPMYELRMKYCQQLIEQKPGDLAFVMEQGWTVTCAGDSDFSDKQSDVEEIGGYTMGSKREIKLNVDGVDALSVAHEAAHAIDVMSIGIEPELELAEKLGHKHWVDTEANYWTSPSESFADTRAGCLGYEIYFDILVMSCGQVNDLINGSDDGEAIQKAARRAK